MAKKPYQKWPVSPNEMAQRLQGKPFGELILHHVKSQSLREIKEGLFSTIGFLPNALRLPSEHWIDLNNEYGLREEFWRSDCGDVLLSIVDRGKAFSASHGVNADDDALLNLFQIVVLSFAYAAHCEERSQQFIEKSLSSLTSRDQAMAKKVVTDRVRGIISLNAAAYMRWVETRKGVTPSAHDIQQYVRGALDEEGFSYDADEPQTIELLAIAWKVEVVDAYIKQSGFFEDLDRAFSHR